MAVKKGALENLEGMITIPYPFLMDKGKQESEDVSFRGMQTILSGTAGFGYGPHRF